jgi:hypothetical protein
MAEDSRKLFVAGLPDTITEEVLKQLFEATGGAVVEVSLPKDRATGRPRGFGFVTLATTDEANAARESLDGSFQGGKSISVRPFQAEPPKRDGTGPSSGGPRGPGGPGGPAAAAPDRTLYVGNLPYDTSVEEVEALITGTGAGPVVRVHLPADPDGRKRGFGFVTMASAESAKSAIELLRGVDVRGRRLVVNLAHPKGERPPREDRGFGGGGGGGYGGGGGGGYGGGGGGGYGGPPGGGGGGGYGGPPGGGGGGGGRFGGGPPPQRKTFDERRRKHDGDGGGGGRGGGGGGRRGKNDWDTGKDDWDD